MVDNFNSSMVRLEDLTNKLKGEEKATFQFQYGAIGSCAGLSSNDTYLVFQFQYGAIGRRYGTR